MCQQSHHHQHIRSVCIAFGFDWQLYVLSERGTVSKYSKQQAFKTLLYIIE
jgi:hypothetical protein